MCLVFGLVTQMVEYNTFNVGVKSSSLFKPIGGFHGGPSPFCGVLALTGSASKELSQSCLAD